MHILYIDGSGSIGNPDEDHFILAGVSVFERGIYHLIKEVDNIVKSWNIGDPDLIEIHGSPMFQGKKGTVWSSFPTNVRLKMMQEALGALHSAAPAARAFGIAVHKAARAPDDPVEYAFEEICNRFNMYLNRRWLRGGKRAEDRQRGLIVMDESSYEESLQHLARGFRVTGTRWGELKNLAEVPLFVDSRASRIVQIADLIAFAIWRRYEFQDARLFDPIITAFDAEGGVIHGLVHHRPHELKCYCPACMSREKGRSGFPVAAQAAAEAKN